ncbi:MAG: phosphopantothenoylcysteine decarboxylase [Clostridiales bacterium]|jgi:phosphopantothenoylcysteine decarboxylase/phosphopantothenoylcysteine decarboxylase/phosphopantothenate--cysteine ligase|nr:phosphopantothenoylcysteine decarboxylase [Clostridiales bacterium]
MTEIILGITGGIAAYKAADIANQLTKKADFSVQVIMTDSAAKFITPLTMRTLTGNRVYTDMFDEAFEPYVRHIALAKRAKAALIAPATANTIAKLATGVADNLLTTTILAMEDKPIVIAPSMNTAMYENPVTQENINKLLRLGARFIEPRESILACGDLGRGALAEVDVIVNYMKDLLA